MTLTGWIKSFGRLPQIVEHRIDIGQYHQVTDVRCHQFESCCGGLSVKYFLDAIEGFGQLYRLLFLRIVV